MKTPFSPFRAFLLLVLAALQAGAREIPADEAAVAAAAWVRRGAVPLGVAFGSAKARDAATVRGDNGAALYHVVRMEGGGTVVTSAESGIVPVVAFLDGDGVDDSSGSPLGEILSADMASRTAQVLEARAAAPAESRPEGVKAAAAGPFAAEEAAWAALLGGGGMKYGVNSVSDVRVPKLLSTTWGQSGGAANYYTPPGPDGSAYNYVCGCVALAGAQIARYWEYPEESRPQVSRTCYVTSSPVTMKTMGGKYDWSNMPDAFSSLATVQKQAIGKLCFDFGVATHMDWNLGGGGESGAFGFCLGSAFSSAFGYANSKIYCGSVGGAVSASIVQRAVFANLDAKCPVSLGIDEHQVVADGYGYVANTPYTHVNLGWKGSGDAWYNLPTVDPDGSSYSSTVLDQLVYNIFPRKTGDLLTGRVLDGNGNPVEGAAVRAVNGSSVSTATSDANGVYALWVAGGKKWQVSASHAGAGGTKSVDVAACVSTVASGESCTPGTGTVGNSWGNDIVLDMVATYAVVYNPGSSGTGAQLASTKTHDVALTLKNAVFSRTGYAQTGWATSDGGAKEYDLGGSYTANANVTLYPCWTPISYSVSYNCDGGSKGALSPSSGTFDAWLRVSAPTKTGAVFAGWTVSSGLNTSTAWWWYDGADASMRLTSSTTKCANGESGVVQFRNLRAIAGSVTLKANWTAKTYAVAYDPGAFGSGERRTATKTHGVALALEGAVFTREGYLQTGWATTDGGAKAYDLAGSYTADAEATLYPVWEIEVVPKPDLAFFAAPGRPAAAYLAAAADPSEPADVFDTDGTILLVFCYANSGTADAAAHSIRAVLEDSSRTEIENWTWTLSSLAANEWTAVENASFSPPSPGAYTLTIELDCGGEVDELDEDDNRLTLGFSVDEPPVFPSPVYRFYSKTYKGHFFTVSEEEKDDLVATNPNWKFEGTAYMAFTNQVDGTVPLYRFYSKSYRGHFFTIDEEEMWTVRNTNPNWKYEGVAYYVYPEEAEGSVPVYRFWSKAYRHHFYTTDEAEKDTLVATNPNWNYETVAFWALPAESAEWALAAQADGTRIVRGGVAGIGGALLETRGDAPDAGELLSHAEYAEFVSHADFAEFVSHAEFAEYAEFSMSANAGFAGRAPSRPESAEGDLHGGASPPGEPLSLRLSLPPGEWNATLWSAADGMLADEPAEGGFDFVLPATGVWHWLRVRGGEVDGGDAFSLWLRAE